MTNQDSDGLFESDGEERRELSWTETDWEKYLAEHEEAVRDYLRYYDQLGHAADRIDEVARRMGWEMEAPVEDEPAAELDTPDAMDANFETEWEPYTLHRNPVYIATKALYAGLLANWERIAAHAQRINPAVGLSFQGSLYRGRENALQAVQALDLGDYTLAICFFKRGLRELNDSLARLSHAEFSDATLLGRYREYAQPRLFDLREIWLRVMNECRLAE
ncbi:MAG: hypothetical protein HYV95_00350 [Opitutae bacterium]|nr:hypothetical protein [Opitutae bacterium]